MCMLGCDVEFGERTGTPGSVNDEQNITFGFLLISLEDNSSLFRHAAMLRLHFPPVPLVIHSGPVVLVLSESPLAS
jgi:hypothetical protein